LIGFLGLALVIPITKGVLTHAEKTEKLIPTLGQNVIINLVMPVLTAVGILIG
jgi:hypothetical protein